ncbi:MAG: GxGYxYP domain-containing protein [Candidatus Helarchaeota archaeon]
MDSSRRKKSLIIILICSFLVGLGLVPLFIPPYIYDFSHINWHGQDLSENITGDDIYFTYFHNFTIPTELAAYDIRALPYEEQLALTTLQGLVNRMNTSLYFIYRDSDAFWLERLKDYYGVNYTVFTYSSYWEIIEKYNTSIKGVIIYDETFMDTVNVATFLAGLNDCLVIHPKMLINFTSILGVSLIYDFRGNFSSRVALYTWAFENYWLLANHQMIASRPPEKTYFRDYIVASKIFTFWLQCGPFGDPEEIKLFRRIIAETPPNIPVWGWFTDPGGALGEYEAVKTISHAGKYSFCAAIPDLTVLSAFQDSSLIQHVIEFNVSDYKLENKIYVTMVVSDGDNVDYCTNYLLENIWQNSERGTVPLGITLEPLMARISPVVLKYYYENATENEYFLAGPSGAGYCYVDMTPTFPSFLNRTKYAMEQCNMDQVWLLNGYEGFELPYSSEVLNAYTSADSNFSAIYLDYHDFQEEANFLINGVPVFHSMWVERENELIGKLKSLANLNPKSPLFVFVGWNSWDFSITKAKNVIDALPNETYTFLRPDQFSALFKRYQIEQTSPNEDIVLLFSIIFFVISSFALTAVWTFWKKEAKTEQISSHNYLFRSVTKVFYVLLDLILLLTVYYCFYSTILSVFYLLFLIISMFIGIQLRVVIENRIGIHATMILSITLSSVGFLLFAMRPQLIIILGFPLGILLARQIQSNHLVFESSALGKRSFLYSVLIAGVVVLLVPSQYYPYLIWITAIIYVFVSIALITLFKNSCLPYFNNFNHKIRQWYLRGILYGFCFILLFNPSFVPQRFFFHVFWGLETSPTKLSLSFTIAAIYILAILIFELLRLNMTRNSRKIALSLFSAGVICYITIPFLVQGVVFFVGSILLYIVGLLAVMDTLIITALPFPTLEVTRSSDPRGFVSQTLFWTIFGLFLIFIPPTIIVVDAQAVFGFIGLTGIEQIVWSPLAWTLFYTPVIYMILVIPVTIYIIIFGIVNGS